MKMQEVIKALELTIVNAPQESLEGAVSGGYVSDLLSNVMGQAKGGDIWITMQGHQNIIAVASLIGLAAIVVAGGTIPENETVRKAESEGVCLLSTKLSSFEAAGRLYQLGIGKHA